MRDNAGESFLRAFGKTQSSWSTEAGITDYNNHTMRATKDYKAPEE